MSSTRAVALPCDHVRISTNAITEPFWQAAKRSRLAVPGCADCGHFRLPPTPFCPNCQSENVDWATLRGSAVLFSFASSTARRSLTCRTLPTSPRSSTCRTRRQRGW